MLQLKNIVKTYEMGEMRVEALKGIDLSFRKNEFVSILGPSGCGKTTMLNIIGGLDRYTSGDLSINGISTKEYKDVDWDIYRNNSIGFVFQSYNLISHQTVYSNVELALTLAGISRAERHRRVVEVLEKVGLSDQLYKKPTQMSGGQMQRVAIARALVNNPEILLADEPTGAIDSATSVQIMELLKEIAKDRLVIMVTHNAEIAGKYSTRTVRLLDGLVVDDSDPYHPEIEAAKRGNRKKISMSFLTALTLSLNNLLTKKTRTILTAFAGSIGIIGIALILSLSSGMQSYVDNLASDTLSTYPIDITSQTMDMNNRMMMEMGNNRRNSRDPDRDPDRVYANRIINRMMVSMSSQILRNDLREFKRHIESEEGQLFREHSNSIKYGYSVDLQIFKSDTARGVLQVNPSDLFSNFGAMGGMNGGMANMSPMGSIMETWTEMLDNEELLKSQYDVIAGRRPEAYNEIVLVVSSRNELSDMALYSLGMLDTDELEDFMLLAMRGEEIPAANRETAFDYDEILSLTFKLLLNTDFFVKENGHWTDMREDEGFLKGLIENALELRVVGILRPAENAAATSINGSVGYTSALTEYAVASILESLIAKEQLANPEMNVLTGHPFDVGDAVENLTMEDVYAMVAGMPEDEQEQTQAMLAVMTEEQILAAFSERIKSEAGKATYDDNLLLMGIVDFDSPNSIKFYPKDFDSKIQLETLIAEYNEIQEEAGNDEFVIHYVDIVGIMTSSISNIINIISYVLIAFVAISLVVSSIMIAIITYISVLERTKEIGILRSIGASKKDITRVFNAETFIEGFVAGGLGIIITIILNFPINAIIKNVAGVSNIASLPPYGAVGLIIISVILTLIAGFIPSKMAAKKDPVVALRTE